MQSLNTVTAYFYIRQLLPFGFAEHNFLFYLTDEGCSEGFYGANCQTQCLTCNSIICMPEDGRCLNGCVDGKNGDFCQEGEHSEVHN